LIGEWLNGKVYYTEIYYKNFRDIACNAIIAARYQNYLELFGLVSFVVPSVRKVTRFSKNTGISNRIEFN